MEKLNDMEIDAREFSSLDEKIEKLESEMNLLRIERDELIMERDEWGDLIGRTDYDENGMATDY
jgi:ATP-dependent protease ClpP protease subunit